MKLKFSDIIKKPEGLHSDGNNLYLRVRGTRRTWVYRVTKDGKTYLRTLGSTSELSLSEARSLARKYILEPKKEDPFFSEVYESALTELSITKNWKNKKQLNNALSLLRRYALPYFGSKKISDITKEDIYKAVSVIRKDHPLASSYLYSRLKNIFSIFIFKGYCEENPVPLTKEFLTSIPSFHTVNHYSSIDYKQLPSLIKELYSHEQVSYRAVILITLTALRLNECTSLKWTDIHPSYIEVPAPLRKGKKKESLKIPRTKEINHILSLLDHSKEYIFSTKLYQSTVGRALHTINPNITIHGMRSSYKNWSMENDLNFYAVEISLSHSIGNQTVSAYARTDMYEERKKILEKWNRYLFKYINI